MIIQRLKATSMKENRCLKITVKPIERPRKLTDKILNMNPKTMQIV
jgi:hypothetical protein